MAEQHIRPAFSAAANLVQMPTLFRVRAVRLGDQSHAAMANVLVREKDTAGIRFDFARAVSPINDGGRCRPSASEQLGGKHFVQQTLELRIKLRIQMA